MPSMGCRSVRPSRRPPRGRQLPIAGRVSAPAPRIPIASHVDSTEIPGSLRGTSAASSLDGTQVSPQFAGQNAKLVAALKKAQGAYKSLSSNAKKGSKSGYSKASKNVSKAESQVNKALSALKGG